jgi:hypothetical protein
LSFGVGAAVLILALMPGARHENGSRLECVGALMDYRHPRE